MRFSAACQGSGRLQPYRTGFRVCRALVRGNALPGRELLAIRLQLAFKFADSHIDSGVVSFLVTDNVNRHSRLPYPQGSVGRSDGVPPMPIKGFTLLGSGRFPSRAVPPRPGPQSRPFRGRLVVGGRRVQRVSVKVRFVAEVNRRAHRISSKEHRVLSHDLLLTETGLRPPGDFDWRTRDRGKVLFYHLIMLILCVLIA